MPRPRQPLPLPLKAQFIDDEGHKGSVVVGRIDEVYRDGGLIRSAGVWDNSPEADKAYAMIEGKMWRGVSVDLDAVDGDQVQDVEGAGGDHDCTSISMMTSVLRVRCGARSRGT